MNILRKYSYKLFCFYCALNIFLLCACSSSEIVIQNNKHPQSIFMHKNITSYDSDNGITDVYLYSSAVCSTEPSGWHWRYDNSIMQTESDSYAFKNFYNDISTMLPSSLSDKRNIKISNNQNEFLLILKSDESQNGELTQYETIYNQENEAITYNNVFGNNVYNIIIDSCGINTELIVREKNFLKYVYNIQIDNVLIDNECPDYTLFRNTVTNEAVAIIYKPIAYNKKESILDAKLINRINMEVKDTGNGNYEIEINLNKSYIKELKDEYIINQSFYFYRPSEPDSAIYETLNKSCYLNDTVILGNSLQYGESQLLVRFDCLYDLNINPDYIIEAKYLIYEISKTSKKAQIALYPVISDWCSINVRWESKPLISKEYSKIVQVKESKIYEFDITDLLKEWMHQDIENEDSLYAIKHGFTIVNLTPDIPKLFFTGDNGINPTCIHIRVKKAALLTNGECISNKK